MTGRKRKEGRNINLDRGKEDKTRTSFMEKGAEHIQVVFFFPLRDRQAQNAVIYQDINVITF